MFRNHSTLCFFTGGEAVENIGFGMSTAPILASNVSCNGSEYELGDCENSTDIPALCTHELDAAASCQPGYSKFVHKWLCSKCMLTSIPDISLCS